METLSIHALKVLTSSYADSAAFTVTLPPETLPRTLYEEVNEVLVRIGGKWNSRRKTHVYPYDPAPLLSAVLLTGQMPPRNPTAFFPTPVSVVDRLLSLVDFNSRTRDGLRILEPSAGSGAILDGICSLDALGCWQLDCCEILPINRVQLEKKGYRLAAEDFMSYVPDLPYDVIVMNPPFSLDSDKQAYITHALHAWSMLKENGILVAVCPPGFLFNSDKRSKEFLNMVETYGGHEKNEDGAFKASGTGVATVNVWLHKFDHTWRRIPYCGYGSWHVWCAQLWMESVPDFTNRVYAMRDWDTDRLREGVKNLYKDVQKHARERFDPVDLSDADHEELLEHQIQIFND